MTGKNPGKHGLFHFISPIASSYEFSVVNATKRRSKTVFRLASEAGKRIVSINVPVTYPPEKLNGTIVTGMMTPRGKCFTHTEELSRQLLDEGYIVDLWDTKYASDEEYVEAAMDMSLKRLKASRKILSEDPWDLAMLVFVGSDKVQHHVWERKDLIEKYYVFLDGLLAELLSDVDHSTHVMLMSDHGFTSVKGTFLVNEWLARRSFLKKHRLFLRMPVTRLDILRKKKYGLLFTLKYLLHTTIASVFKGRLLSYPQRSINFRKSKAFSRPAEVIYINVKGLWKSGMVEPGMEYNNLKRAIAEELQNLRDSRTGQKVIEDAVIKDDVYSGECLNEAPDIILLPKDDGYALKALGAHHSFIKRDDDVNSCHSMNGIFFLSGPGVREGFACDTIQMVDCVPTVLHLLGIPLPEDVDGRILKELFVDGSSVCC